MSIPRRELFEVWRQGGDITSKNATVLTYVLDSFHMDKVEGCEKYECLKKTVKTLNSHFSEKWKKCNRSSQVFLSRHSEWLDEPGVYLPTETSKPKSKGRPAQEFSEVGSQAKRQKVLPLVESYTPHELLFAASTSLRKSGKRDAALMVQTVASGSPKRATKMKKVLRSPAICPIKYTPEEALALFVDGHYTKRSYNMMRIGAKKRNADIYPSYKVIQRAKQACYPDKEHMVVTQKEAKVQLQALVDHTVVRLVHAQKDVLQSCGHHLSEGLILTYKWGCDGSAGHSSYKQTFGEEGSGSHTDAYLFVVCLVPLRLTTKSNDILWNNPRPSSTRYCRPVKILFKQETSELSKKEISSVEDQINRIVPTTVLVANEEITVSHSFQLTMIDGKVFGVITEVSTQTCGICGATPKVMNNIEKVMKRVPNVENYKYGLSTLHAWIRSFETLLHISYRLPIKKWQVRDASDKAIVEERKRAIRESLRERMGLLVDIPKPGFGTTNDGNTARRFFLQSSLAASITGIDEHLVHRLSIILRTMSCGYAVNTDAFQEYARETAMHYIKLYPWYYMPASVHRILIHGAQIIQNAVLPIGMLSEEALESRNKDLKKIRELHTRKISREKTMEDLFHALLFTSDPLISSLSVTSQIRKQEGIIDRDVINLLADPALALHPIDDYSEDGDDTDFSSQIESDDDL